MPSGIGQRGSLTDRSRIEIRELNRRYARAVDFTLCSRAEARELGAAHETELNQHSGSPGVCLGHTDLCLGPQAEA